MVSTSVVLLSRFQSYVQTSTSTIRMAKRVCPRRTETEKSSHEPLPRPNMISVTSTVQGLFSYCTVHLYPGNACALLSPAHDGSAPAVQPLIHDPSSSPIVVGVTPQRMARDGKRPRRCPSSVVLFLSLTWACLPACLPA
jgi:hypothetical protein